jgi:transposase, IS5 family
MYRKEEPTQIPLLSFKLPFEGKLLEDNRWVMMASLIPWSEFEEEYASFFDEKIGAPAKSFRMALGALIIKEKLGISDRETIEQIKENPYLQYFIGMSSYRNEAPFDASMLVHFRERISADLVNTVNQEMVKRMLKTTSAQPTEKKIEEKEKEISESATPATETPLTNLESEPKNRGLLSFSASPTYFFKLETNKKHLLKALENVEKGNLIYVDLDEYEKSCL